MLKYGTYILALILSLSICLPVFAAPRFSDIAGHWCEPEINQATDLGFLDGYPDGTMRPDNKVTRAEFLKMVVAAYKLQTAQMPSDNVPLIDVSGHWVLQYLIAALNRGIVEPSEYTEGKYEPDRYITRDEAAAYTIRALGLNAVARARDPNSALFSDMATVNRLYGGGVPLCAELGILKGYEDGTIRGNRTLTRASRYTKGGAGHGAESCGTARALFDATNVTSFHVSNSK